MANQAPTTATARKTAATHRGVMLRRRHWAASAEAVKHVETGVVQTFCISASWGWLIHATVGSFGGVGRRANREGFAA